MVKCYFAGREGLFGMVSVGYKSCEEIDAILYRVGYSFQRRPGDGRHVGVLHGLEDAQ